MVKLFGKPIRVNKSAQDRKALDVGANLFVGNLDPDVDEKVLYDTFAAFGVIVNTPKVMRDPDTGAPPPRAATVFARVCAGAEQATAVQASARALAL